MDINCSPVGPPRTVERHLLRFETRADLDEAVRLHEELGFVRFRDEAGNSLAGRIANLVSSELMAEVDVARSSNRPVATEIPPCLRPKRRPRDKYRGSSIKTPYQAAVMNVATLGIWAFVDCYRSWKEGELRLKAIRARESLKKAARQQKTSRM